MKISAIVIFIFAFSFGSDAQDNPNPSSKIDGEWLIFMNSKDIGEVHSIFNIESEDRTFLAYTRKKATLDILGIWKSSLAKLFTDDFKNGSLIRITDGSFQQHSDSLILIGIFRSAIGNYYFNGKIYNGKLFAKLTNTKGENRGTISGKKANIDLPLNDYPKLVDTALETTKDKIFNPSITESKDWNEFEENIKSVSEKIIDDVEMVFSWYYFANKLPLSHFALIKMKAAEKSTPNELSKKSYLSLQEKSENTAYLKIESFGGTAREMDSVFTIIEKNNYDNLIVDLRNNPGGSVEAGMAFAKNVVDTTLIGGIFLTQKWFSEHNYIPKPNEYYQFPHFTESNFDLIIEGIHKEKGLVLKVIPQEITFKGNLYILTNKQTASTCEPIVYSLKNTSRAIIIGEQTAGAMLNSEIFTLTNGYSLIVPTADYYTTDGFRIDQIGVKPNIVIDSVDALEYVMEEIIED